MPYETHKNKKPVTFKTRLALIITGLVILAILIGLIAWSSVELAKLPSQYAQDSHDYYQALTFGLLNGFCDFIALILLVNICVYSYATKVFKTLSNFNKYKKEHKNLNKFENQASINLSLNEWEEKDRQNVVK